MKHINPMYLAMLQGGPVRVEWLDSQGNDEWKRKENYTPPALEPVSTWGILHSYNAQRIVICGHDGKHWWGNITLIPTSAVLDIHQTKIKATIIQSGKPEGGQGDEKKTAPPRKGS